MLIDYDSSVSITGTVAASALQDHSSHATPPLLQPHSIHANANRWGFIQPPTSRRRSKEAAFKKKLKKNKKNPKLEFAEILISSSSFTDFYNLFYRRCKVSEPSICLLHLEKKINSFFFYATEPNLRGRQASRS